MNCPSCNAPILAGSRWCGICHKNTQDPSIGRLASPGKRLGAYVLDIAVPSVVVMIVMMMGAAGGDSGIGFIIGAVLLLAYAVYALMLFAQGTTPGKKMLGMRVVKEDGSTAGFLTMLLREWVGKFISAMIFYLGFLWILFDRDKQGWHDKLTSTYVID